MSELDDLYGYEKHLYEGETIEDRLAMINFKLEHIPDPGDNAINYYISYKEDVRFLLALLKSNEIRD